MTKIDYSVLPEHMQQGMKRYVEEHIPPGSFLRAVLENDLVGALFRADKTNAARMLDYAYFLLHAAPPDCWGSEEAVVDWLRKQEGKGCAR